MQFVYPFCAPSWCCIGAGLEKAEVAELEDQETGMFAPAHVTRPNSSL